MSENKFGEPWAFGEMPEGKKMILTSSGNYVANVQIHQIPRHRGEIMERFREKNADRIIECVNACAGMDNPTEEIAALKAANKRLAHEIAKLKGEC